MTLPTLEIEGHTIKPNRAGKYFCPHKCGDRVYGLRSWKTEKGIRKHMAECQKSEAGKKLEVKKVEDIATQRLECIACHQFKHAAGDVIHYVRRAVIKPSRDARGRRIRYEEVLRFSSTVSVIIEQSAMHNGGSFQPGYMTHSGFVYEYDILPSQEAAETKATELQKGHDEHLAFSSFCR